jgi:hypothetical protein
MRTNVGNQRVPGRFIRPKRFERTRDLARNRFEQLKTDLLSPVLDDAPSSEVRRQLVLAANEAAAAAWTTPFPLLMLPVLLQEKADEVRQYSARQEQVQVRSAALAANTA